MNKTYKHRKINRKTNRTRKIKTMNSNELVKITVPFNITDVKETILTSAFVYYYGNIKIANKSNNATRMLTITDSFLQLKSGGPIFIMDYANIIHILYGKFKNLSIVFKKFYLFLYNQLRKDATIFIISKMVSMDGKQFDIVTALNEGCKLSKKKIPNSAFVNQKLNIYNLDYSKKISSSIDDVVSYFLCFVLTVYLMQSNKDSNKLQMITNDKQFFDKNLFGLTEQERKSKINIFRDLTVKKVIYNEIQESYSLIEDPLESLLLRRFLGEYVVTDYHNTKDLECNLSLLIEKFLSAKSLNGYFRQNKFPEYNQNFEKKSITKFPTGAFDYANLNNLQKKNLKRSDGEKRSMCNNKKILDNKGNLKKIYYLYAFIKYTQMYLFDLKDEKKTYGNFYGGIEQADIISLF